MKKINPSIACLAIVAVVAGVFLCVGCNDGGVESGGGDAVAYLNRFIGSAGGEQPLIDERDGKIYRTTTIGIQTWMAENLNYEPDGGNGRCYDDDPKNCDKYGRLYDWATAVTVCPSGWRLPSESDMDYLIIRLGGYDAAGGKLKAKSGWIGASIDIGNGYIVIDESGNGSGTDNYGFSALPGGQFDGNAFEDIQHEGYWWKLDEENYSNGIFESIHLSSYSQYILVHVHFIEDEVSEHLMYSVRCLRLAD
jgi:uncharacterized protein (TIGR02145 family)